MSQLSRRERERQVREDEIISAAERVFHQKGYYNASMDEIAKEAQFAKGTVYQYFMNKEDLYFAVTLKGLIQLYSYIQEAIKKGKTGVEKTRLVGEAYYRFSLDFSDTFLLMNFGQHIKADIDASLNYQKNGQYGSMIFKTIAEVIEEGKTDGSIRSDLNTNKAVYSYFLLISGFFSRLSEVGTAYEKYFKISQEEISLFTLDLVSKIIQSAPQD